MKILILGASGIVGQHMRLCQPDSVQAVYARRTVDPLHVGVDLTDAEQLRECLETHKPEVIVNLAGESRPDLVEQTPESFRWINMSLPQKLGDWARSENCWLIHCSTQAVMDTVNEYGLQKRIADEYLYLNPNAIVVRPTFILGVRPLSHVGRPNPVEQMLSGQLKQVNDRWFSPLFARDAARGIWNVLLYGLGKDRIVYLGEPRRVSRYDVACALGVGAEPVSHDFFPGIAPRPVDTTYAAKTTRFLIPWEDGIRQLKDDWQGKQSLDIAERAREIALFLGTTEAYAYGKLSKGFGYLHAQIAEDFNRANPQDDSALLDWYRKTEAYIWELSAYHADPGFNYRGLCRGIADRLKAAGAKKVLCLGDGIGDLTLSLYRMGLEPVYHDLAKSRTDAFARFRFWMRTGEQLRDWSCTTGWEPVSVNGNPYDAVISLDFLEHVPNVPQWTKAIKEVLVPGGFFCAQNAFGIGSGRNGSIPMHLSQNDRYQTEWDSMLAQMGFRQESPNWYRT